MSPSMPHEVVLPFPVPRAEVPRVTAWRSTWVVSSIQTLKQRGYYEKYAKLLVDAHRDAVLTCVAGTWLTMDVARAHYNACDALRLTRAEQLDNGLAVGQRAQGTVLSTVTRVATGAGVTPWTIVPQMNRLWERGAQGGGASVLKVGPKEGYIDMVGCELFDIPYFRHAFGGVILGILRLFTQRAYVHDETPPLGRGECLLRLQWV